MTQNNSTSIFSILRLITKFICDFFAILKTRNKIKQEEENRHHQQVLGELQNGYNKIDKEKEQQKENDTQNRLNNMFK